MKNSLLMISLLFATTSHAAFFGIEGQILRDTALIQNGGFENGDSQWTESGSSVLGSETSGVNYSGIGAASGSWDASAASETLTSDQVTIPNGLLDSKCIVTFKHKGGDSTITALVIDGTLATIGSIQLETAAVWTDSGFEFSCPSSGTMAVRFSSSSDAPIIYLDKIFLGESPDRGVAVNPIRYDKTRSIGTVGSVANDQGPLVDGDITFANSAYFPLAGDALNDATQGGDLANINISFDEVGFFGRENVASNSRDGVTNYLGVTDSYYNRPSDTQSFSYGGWFYSKNWDTPGTFYAIANTNSVFNDFSYALASDSTRTAMCMFALTASPSSINTSTSLASGAFNPNSWHHLVCVYDGSNMNLYVDGKLTSSTAAATINQTASTELFSILGSLLASGGHNWDGSVQDVLFTQSALSEDQINAIYSKRFTNHHQIAGGHVLTNDSLPYSDPNDKYAFWNLSDANDGSNGTACSAGTVACNLTNNGTIPFTGLDIFGQSGIAILDGVDDSFSSTDAYFNPSPSTPRTMAGWVKASDGTTGILFNVSTDGALANSSWELKRFAGGEYALFVTDGSTSSDTTFGASLPGEWHHLAATYDGVENWKMYLDGVHVDSAIKTVNQPPSDLFRVGARGTAANTFWAGSVQSVFYGNVLLSDEDIKKLASAKINTGITIPVANQSFSKSLWGREDGKINNQLIPDWVVDNNSTGIYLNTGLPSGSNFNMKIEDNGFSIQTVASSTYASGELSAAPSFPINHGLPSRPKHTVVRIQGQVSAGTWEDRDGLCDADDTQITCDLSGLLIDATHKVEIIASMTPASTAVPTASATELGLVKGNEIVGATISIIPGFKGEYKEASCTATTTTVSADTFIDAIGMSITLEPGVWLIGYDVAVTLDAIAAGVTSSRANIVITDSLNVLVPKTTSYVTFTGENSVADVSTLSPSRQTVVVVSSTTTYKIRLRSSSANTTSTASIHSDNITGGFTNPDNSSNIWALRL